MADFYVLSRLGNGEMVISMVSATSGAEAVEKVRANPIKFMRTPVPPITVVECLGKPRL